LNHPAGQGTFFEGAVSAATRKELAMKRGALAAVIWVVVAVTGTACGGDNAMVQA